VLYVGLEVVADVPEIFPASIFKSRRWDSSETAVSGPVVTSSHVQNFAVWTFTAATKVKVKLSHYRPEQAHRGSRRLGLPDLLDNRHLKVVGCQTYGAAAFTPRSFPGTHF
jgi:hypothetical protein